MAYIGFLLITVVVAAGTVLMWIFEKEDKDGEEEDNGPDPGSGAAVDKPAG